MCHSEHKFVTFKLAFGSSLEACIITNENNAVLKQTGHNISIYWYRSVYRGILRQIKGFLIWSAKDGYLCDLPGNYQENYQFCLLNQIGGSFNRLLFIFWSFVLYCLKKCLCLYMAVHSRYSAMLFSSPAAASWPLPALTPDIPMPDPALRASRPFLLTCTGQQGAQFLPLLTLSCVQLIHFPGLTLRTVRPWIYELQVTVIVLPVRLFCVGQ